MRQQESRVAKLEQACQSLRVGDSCPDCGRLSAEHWGIEMFSVKTCQTCWHNFLPATAEEWDKIWPAACPTNLREERAALQK